MSEHYDELETRTPEAREGALMARLPGLVRHAKENAPGWARRLAEVDPDTIHSRKSLATLPVLRKSVLAELQEADPPFGGLITVAISELGALYMSPGPVFDPEAADDDPFRAARALHAAGMRRGHVLQNCFGYHMTPGAWMVHHAARKMGCVVIPAGIGQTEQQLELVRRFRPDAYVGTPSFLRILLEKADELGVAVSFTKAFVSGEAFPPSMREAFAARGIQAFQAYATADIGLIAYETPAREGMVVDEDIVLEIVRPGTGDPVAPGEVGEVVVTTFNPDYPLIRFGTGDLSAVLPGASPCGRTNVRIRGWMGRADQTTKVKGMFVHPGQVAQVVRRHPEITRARLVVDNPGLNDRMTLMCEVAGGGSETLAGAIAASIRELTKLRGEVAFLPSGALANDGKVIDDVRVYQ